MRSSEGNQRIAKGCHVLSADPALLGLALAAMVLQVLDIWTTNAILAAGGRERNPVVRWCMARCGRWWWVPKLAVVGLALVALVAEDADWRLVAGLDLAYVAVVGQNLWQMRRMGLLRRGR
jgi:hypothetical protein